MDHRSLRRKILEEMWDNTDSMKSEEQGISWLVQLKEDIRRIQEEGSSADDDDAVDCDEEWNGEGGVQLPSNGLEVEPMSSSQSDDDGDLDCDEERDEEVRDWMASDGLEVELSPERHTPEQRVREDKPPRPPATLSKSPGRASRGSALLRCLKKRVSVQLDDSKTTRTGEKSHRPSRAKRCKKTLPGDRPGSHICDHCGKNLGSQKPEKPHARSYRRQTS
ncbi:uncharacterized protein LOC121845335 [Oncorhynchus tshawytscha]|uniref:uncharacterized protein LOC121845335 n=1 Tax=Oncorhynchus tshawytscha TaxID=74940 RepID=UPI001C3D3707|nr:uncharacterized protein LOC121845335 [Oncorhynchus tshawytscha]